MKLIKRQTTNLRSIQGPGVSYDINDQVILDSKTGLLMPKGGTSDRPFILKMVTYVTTAIQMNLKGTKTGNGEN